MVRYVEGINLLLRNFTKKWLRILKVPKTSQTSIAKLDEILTSAFKNKGYTHALGLFLSSGISGFTKISSIGDFERFLTIAFSDTLITGAPLWVSWLKALSLTCVTRAMIFAIIRIS